MPVPLIPLHVMYRVLVPVDEDAHRALHQAKYAAGLPNAADEVEATVLYVVPPAELTEADEVEFSEIDSAVEAAEHLESKGVTVNRVVGDGGVSEQIIRTANELDSNELVMGGRKRSGVTRVLLGSTVLDVFLSTPRPVTITGTGMVFGDGQRHLLLPVDRDRDRARHQAEYVSQLPGAAENVTATVLYVFRHQDYTGAPPHDFEEVEAAVDTADYLEENGIAVERSGIGGEIASTILDTAEDLEADGIVMGGRKRSGVQKVLMGSTAQDILLSAGRPVTITG